MATVYVARDLKHGRAVAIKVLRPELAAVLGTDRFLREIEIAANLVHPHILPLHDSGEADDLLYYVMPYVEGESLRALLERERQLPVEEALKITGQVLSALSHAHSRGIVHRDIKPENILLSAGEAVVADFGIARAIGVAGSRLTQAGMSLGTPSYMSPEQIAGDEDVDARSDLYSVGCMLYEMLAGEPPYTGGADTIIEQQLTAEAPRVSQQRRTVTPEVEEAILTALHKTPADRFPTAARFQEAIGRVTTAVPTPIPAPRSRLVVAGVVGAVAVVAAIAAWQWFNPPAVAAARQLDLAVFPFRPTGGGAEEYSEALADLLTSALDGTPGVTVADPWSLWRPLRPSRDARAEAPEPDEARTLATGVGAARYVLASALRSADELNLTVRLYGASEQPEHSFSAAGTVDSLPALVDRVAVELIARLRWDSAPPDLPRLESYTTNSSEALKAYLRAKELMRRGRVVEAEAVVDTALALDSTFALALVDAITIKSWARYLRGEFFRFMDLAEQAERWGDSLSERNRLRLQAMMAAVRTDGTRAAEATGRILELDSTDFNAWNNLAYYHLVYGWQYGRTEDDAIRAAERIGRIDSAYAPGAVLQAQLALATNDSTRIAGHIARLEALDTTTVLVRSTLLGLRAANSDDAHFTELIDRVATGPPNDWIAVNRSLRMVNPARAEQLLAHVRESAGPGFPTWAAEAEQGRLWIAEGRLHAVDSAIAAGAYRTNDLFRNMQRFLVSATMTGVGDTAIAARAAASLAAYVPPDSALEYFETRPVWWTGWLVAAYNAMFGDTAITHRWREVIGTLPPGGTSTDYRGALQSDLDARLTIRRGGAVDTALALAERAYDLWTIHTENDWEALAAPAMRFHLGLLYRSANRPERAEAMFRSLVPPGTWMGFLSARASYELGELAEARDDLSGAARYYRQAAMFWERGGSEAEAWAARARTGLERTLRQIG